MKVIVGNKIKLDEFKKLTTKPNIFEKGTSGLWDDKHVSKELLKMHLDDEHQSASRPKDTIISEAKFITSYTKMNEKCSVLELGCGPGLYTKEFANTGAQITALDISKNSLKYAEKNTCSTLKNVTFIEKNYLNLDYEDKFDIITLIFYDFCALNPNEQVTLLNNVHNALKENGVFILDVMSENRQIKEYTEVTTCEDGFWSPEPYIEIFNSYLFIEQDFPKTECLQYTLIDDSGNTKVVRIYHTLFSIDEVSSLFTDNGFNIENTYNNLEGHGLTKNSETYAFILQKV